MVSKWTQCSQASSIQPCKPRSLLAQSFKNLKKCSSKIPYKCLKTNSTILVMLQPRDTFWIIFLYWGPGPSLKNVNIYHGGREPYSRISRIRPKVNWDRKIITNNLFTNLAPRPIHSMSCNVRGTKVVQFKNKKLSY